jgi:mono/diheme cytochrome c family protein
MKNRTINLLVFGLATLTIALFGCSSGNVSDTTATGAAIDGAALYASDCSGCHGPVAASGKKGASVSQIQGAIAHNWGGMGAFASLTTDQLKAIAAALVPVTTTNTPATTASLDGAALYGDNCSSCHGALATSSKGGALVSAIQAAISGNFGGMGRFSNLTTAQLQAIANALASVQASTPGPAPATADGAALYAQYCSSCHGALATSSKRGATASRIQAGISSNYGGMGQFSYLTTEQVQAIATALGTSTPTPAPTPASTDGAALYTTYCSSCHGSLAASTKTGRTATQIQTAIGSVGSMSSLSNLATTQVQAIASALATASTPAPTDGAALYTSYCSSCHGALASSSVRGSSANTISSALSGVSQMSSLSLTSTQIQAIATALGTTATTSPTPAPTTTDGATLYTTYCASCHGPLATSTKSGATAAQIQTGISNNLGGMGQFSNLTSTQIQAIASALSTGTAPTTTPPVCGSCHAIPPSTGHHSYHVNSQGLSCGTCHGTGYSSTSVNSATHNNGVVNISSTPGWNPSTRTCSNSCHGTESW